MTSIALVKFKSMSIGAKVLKLKAGSSSPVTADQSFIDETFYKATIAHAVGCWEGYVEAVLKEFLSKVRVQSNRRTWSLTGIIHETGLFGLVVGNARGRVVS